MTPVVQSTPPPGQSAPTPAEGQSAQAPNLATALGTEGAEAAPGAPEAPKQESASQAMRLIAQERKRVMEMKAKAAEREKAIAEREARIEAQEGRYSKKPQTPLEALQAAGFSYQDATEYLMNDNRLTPDQRLKQLDEKYESRFKAQEDARKQAEAQAAEQAKEAHAQAVSEFQGRIWDHVASDPVKYELSNLEDEGDIKSLGFQLADLHFQQNKKVLSETEVADLVEGYLEERVTKLASAKKVQSRWKPAEPAASDLAKPEASQAKTLAGAITNSSAPTYSPAKSESERTRRAMEALERLGK